MGDYHTQQLYRLKTNTTHNYEKGLSSEQTDSVSEGFSHSGEQLPDTNTEVNEKVEKVFIILWGKIIGIIY